ncbi:MAG: RNA polymerase sigma factor [Planctomycetota bacterium]
MTDITQLLDQRSDWIRGLARSLIRDAHAADDVAQEALLAATSSGRADRGWLVGVVQNLAANRWRRDLRRAKHETRRARRDAGQRATSAAAAAARVEQERLLAEAVLALDPPFRDVVLLRAFDGLPPRRIAERLGIPVATVNSRWTRALGKLRQHLDAAHGDDGRTWLVALAPTAALGGRPGMTTITSGTVGGAIWMSKQALWVAAALFLGLTGWWMVAGVSRGPTAPEALVGTAELVRSGAAAGAAPVDPAAAGRAARGRRDASMRTAAAEGPLASDTVRVRVVDGTTGRPVPEAEVVRIELTPDLQARWALVRVRDGGSFQCDAAFALGIPVALDADASFAFPRSVAKALWLARHGSTHGVLMMREALQGDGQTLRLVPLREVDVEVVDVNGRPLPGVPVALYSEQSRGSRGVIAIERPAATEHAVRLSWNPETPPGPVAVGLYMPGAPEPVAVPPGRPDTPITLRSPPVGAVEIGPLGRTAEGVLPIVSMVTAQEQDAHGGMGWETVVGDDGVARFWPVAVGLGALRARIPAADRPILIGGEGPARAGQVVRFGVAAARTLLTARLVEGPTARPLADMQCWVRMLPADWDRGYASRTDEHGRIRIPAGPPLDGTQRTLEVGLDDDSRRTVRIALPEDRLRQLGTGSAPVVADLGDLDFVATQVLAAGIVIGPGGQPIADVLVEVGAGADAAARRLAWARTGADGRFVLRIDAELTPDPAPDLWVKARANGRFGHARTPVTEPRGIRIEMTALGAIQGRIETGMPDTAHLFGVTAWREGAPLDARGIGARNVRGRPVGADGSFELQGVATAPHTVAVYARNGNDPYWTGPIIAQVPRVPVVAGRTTTPAEVASIDLRRRFRVVDLEVQDPAGRPLAPHAYTTDQASRFVGVATDRLAVPVAVDALDLVLDGHVSARVTLRPGRQRVVLASLRRVALRVRSTYPLPPGQRLMVDLELDDGQPAGQPERPRLTMHQGARPYPGHQPDAEGWVEIPVARPGRYRVVVRVTTAAPIGAGYVAPVALPPGVCPAFDLAEAAVGAPREVRLPADAVQAASAALENG